MRDSPPSRDGELECAEDPEGDQVGFFILRVLRAFAFKSSSFSDPSEEPQALGAGASCLIVGGNDLQFIEEGWRAAQDNAEWTGWT
jgi:hypothetical protein